MSIETLVDGLRLVAYYVFLAALYYAVVVYPGLRLLHRWRARRRAR